MRITWGQIEHQILLSLVLFAVFVTSGNFDPGFPRGGERGGGGVGGNSHKSTGVFVANFEKKRFKRYQGKILWCGLKLFYP